MRILKNNGEVKNYIFKTDLRKFLQCDNKTASSIFNKVKEYELEIRGIEIFENRVPQELFHEWRKQKKRG